MLLCGADHRCLWSAHGLVLPPITGSQTHPLWYADLRREAKKEIVIGMEILAE
jgi:hypothetical protein